MTGAGESTPDPHADALLAARLCAIDPGLGGMVLRGGADLRDAVVAELRAGLPEDAPVRRVPSHIDDERLLGGIDLTATLARGVAVPRTGLLAEADGGVVVIPMAERLSDATAGRLAAVIDTGEVVIERDGVALRADARFATVALDDGVDPDERTPAALAERLAFWVDLSGVRRAASRPSFPREGGGPGVPSGALLGSGPPLRKGTGRVRRPAHRSASPRRGPGPSWGPSMATRGPSLPLPS
ncbi:hypothetical protein [Sphingomonas ginsenosidivorax]|uniref:hypothetical protein n=1 Tax=Sphingomonas ginsenosidivorax TaxID=862135 RepID=UPI001F55059B|nr:hypothetical protein [Sphingomonas ginsenosidivorax]